MWFTKKHGPDVDYVESFPAGRVYENLEDGSRWYPVRILDSAMNSQTAVLYEVNEDGTLLYKMVDGIQNIYPEGAPKYMDIDEFMSGHKLIINWQDLH